MKKLLLILTLSFSVTQLIAQTTESVITYKKTDQKALVLELPFEPDMVEEFLVEKMKHQAKATKTNGFFLFKAIKLKSGQIADLYFRVEPKNKREKNASLLYMLVSEGNENFSSSAGNSAIYTEARDFMNDMVPAANAYKLELDINAGEEEVEKAEKELEKLQDKEKALIKKIEALNEDLKENRKDQQAQQSQVENAKTRLKDLMAKKA